MDFKDVTAASEDGVPDATKKELRRNYIDQLRDHFMSKPFDQSLGVYFPAHNVERYGLTSPARVLGLMRWVLKRAEYRGWYCIVVHDKNGSTLWHPHMLLDGRNGQFDKVRRQLFKFGDVRYNSAGPVKDLGSCAGYMAMRACESGCDSDKWELEFTGGHKKRRPRGSRGRRASGKAER